MKQEFSGSFEMINNEIEQEFSASNGTGKFTQLFFCYFRFLFFYIFAEPQSNGLENGRVIIYIYTYLTDT